MQYFGLSQRFCQRLKMHPIVWVLTTILSAVAAQNERNVVCYWGSWSIYRSGNGNFNTSNIDTKLCTHLIYAFVGLEPNGTIRVLDPFADLPDDGGKDGFNRFNQLREENPSIKTLVSIGGWKQGSTNFSTVTNSAELRNAFVQNAVDFVKKFKFNGLDLAWEYPAQRGGAASDKANYVFLIKQLREAFDKDGSLLTASVAAASPTASQSYDIPELAKYLDFINLMCYDYHGSWENVTSSNAPLYAGSWEKGDHLHFNVNASVRYWLSQGAPAKKLIVGIPFYGHVFTLANVNNTQTGAPASGPGTEDQLTSEPDVFSYLEICQKQSTETWTVTFNKEQRVPFAFRNKQWISYENEESIKEKALFIKELGLGGASAWSIDLDDARGVCGKKFPLLTTLKQEMQ